MSSAERKGLTRVDLYEAVWSEPLVRLAPKCGLSNVGLAKLCRRLKIPIPGPGYWRKRETGTRTPQRPPLPAYSGKLAEGIVVWVDPGIEQPEPRAARLAPALEAATLHPVAALALARLRRTQPDPKYGIVAPGYLGIRVLPRSIDRAVLIADALIKAFEESGGVVGTALDGRGLVVSECDEISFEIKEDPVIGRLSLVWAGPVTGRKTWSDGLQSRVERQLGNFVASIKHALERLRGDRQEAERKKTAWAQLKKRGAEREAAAAHEKAKDEAVTLAMASWREAALLRSFADTIDAAARGGKLAPDIEAMADHARELADRTDPLISETWSGLETADYMSFNDWYARTLALLGQEDGYCDYDAAYEVFEMRLTPEEAAQEIDW